MPLHVVPRDRPGTLALSPLPGLAGDLDADVAAFVAAGVTDVVCLLADDELRRLGLLRAPEAFAHHGMRVHRMPVPDFGVPVPEVAAVLVDTVVQRLAARGHVVVHCRGGVGRSSTVAALVLLREGLTPAQAWSVLAGARGARVPETAAQARFVARAAGSGVVVPWHVRLVEAAAGGLARSVTRMADALRSVRRRG